MALFEALADLVGAAIVTTAPAWDVELAADIAARAYDFPAVLRDGGAAGVLDHVVEAVARDVWVGAETRGLPQAALEAHTAALARIVVGFRPQAALLKAAFERTRAAPQSSPEPAARRISVDIFSRARTAGALAEAGIKDDVALFLIDRVYGHLVDDGTVAPRLRETMVRLAPRLSGRPISSAPGLAALGLSPAATAAIERSGGGAWLADLRDRFGLSERAQSRILRLIDAQQGRPGELALRLEQLSQWLGDAKAQLMKPSNDDAEVRKLKAKAAGALADGDFEGAADALRQIRREVRETRRRTEERLADEVAGLKAQMVEEARATARLAELHVAERDFAAAADLFADAALALPTAERELAWRFELQRADALLRKGEASADGSALAEAISAFASCVRTAAEVSSQNGLAHASLGLGRALAITGEREAGTSRLKDAVAPLRKAIAHLGRDLDKTSFATAQLGLGRVLALIGERESAADVLQEAADAYREALKGIDAKSNVEAVIEARLGLGNALLALEERRGGLELLTEAADVFAAALQHIGRAGDPDRWADAQMNLGTALLGIGEQRGGEARLDAAIEALRLAGEVMTRASAPQTWALIQLNLGNAYAALGERDKTQAKPIEDAIAAYKDALEEFRRDVEPLKWAIAQMNLGTALIRLGERGDKRRNWLAAAGVLVPALEVFELQGATQYADVTRQNLRRFNESWDSLLTPASEAPARAAADKPRVSKAG